MNGRLLQCWRVESRQQESFELWNSHRGSSRLNQLVGVPFREEVKCARSSIGDIAIFRWLGTSNHELAYHGRIVIMDAFYDRPARTASLRFTVDQVRKADVIVVGHAHCDHISDVAPVAAQTGAPVVGSAVTTEEAIALGVPKAQTHPPESLSRMRWFQTK